MEPLSFSEFEPIPDEAWKNQLLRELKGASWEERMIWRAPDGAAHAPLVQPFYRRGSDSPAPQNADPLHNEQSDLTRMGRLSRKMHRLSWYKHDAQGLNQAIQDAVFRDAAGVDVYLPSAQLGPLMTEQRKNGLELPVHSDFSLRWMATDFGDDCPPAAALDLLGYRARSAEPAAMTKQSWDRLATHFRAHVEQGVEQGLHEANAQGAARRQSALYLDNALFCDAGADIPTQMGLCWAALNELFAELMQRGIGAPDIASGLLLRVGTGPNFFFELARLRALRKGWTVLGEALNGQKPFPHPEINSVAGSWNLSRSDPHNNLLRLCTEASSAMLGGADSISLPLFDLQGRENPEFARRLSDNLVLMLERESHLLRVEDPARGSWYIESLTDELGELGWSLFQQIDQLGGYTAALQSGWVQQRIAEARQRKADALRKAGSSWVGVTRFKPSSSGAADLGDGKYLASGYRSPSPYTRKDAALAFEPILPWDAEAELSAESPVQPSTSKSS